MTISEMIREISVRFVDYKIVQYQCSFPAFDILSVFIEAMHLGNKTSVFCIKKAVWGLER